MADDESDPMPIRDRARTLRRAATPAERVLWSRLRRQGLKARFRRQHPIPPYVVDFACVEARLAVEADGGQHAGNARDAARDAFLKTRGWHVLRFWNSEIIGDTDAVLEAIGRALDERGGGAPPSAGGRPQSGREPGGLAPASPKGGRGR